MSVIHKILRPRLPVTALSLSASEAAVVQLERQKGTFALRRAATVPLPAGLLRPDFTAHNIANPVQLCDLLAELSESAGLGKQRKWSAALPEACAASHILTLEQKPASRAELEEVLRWKTERAFGAPVETLRTARELLPVSDTGRTRYLAVGIRLSVLAEYEEIFDALGWKMGFIVPRHIGEARWLANNGTAGDALLISSTPDGFTALVQRNGQPFILRSVPCELADRDDELYRLLLFYRDRAAPPEDAPPLQKLLIIGDAAAQKHLAHIVNDTLDTNLQSLTPAQMGLNVPSPQIDFAAIAAPAGLATLAW